MLEFLYILRIALGIFLLLFCTVDFNVRIKNCSKQTQKIFFIVILVLIWLYVICGVAGWVL